MQEKLIILQKENNDTNKAMAKLLSITPQQYSSKVKGKACFTLDEMYLISHYYKMSMDDIFLPRKVSKCDFKE